MNACSILISSALLVSTGFAHEDPNGDVHPLVTVEKGNIVIWFINNTEKRTSPESNANVYRTVMDTDGSAIVVRQPVPNAPSSIPDWAVKLGSLYPFDTKDRLGLGLPLKWQEPVSDVDGITEHKGNLIFHMSGSGDPFYFGAYDLKAKRLTSAARIGTPGRIYFFPAASSAIVIGKDAYLAWIEERDRKREKLELADGSFADGVSSKTQLVLSKWRIGTKGVSHLPIRQTFDNNVHISIAHIGPRILIAWHEGFGGVALSRSKVWTHLVDLETAVFRSELPYSPMPSNALPISAQSPP